MMQDWCVTLLNEETNILLVFILPLQWLNSFWVLKWKAVFVTIVQECLYPVVHEHVRFSSSNVMSNMCFTLSSITLWSIKEMLFIILLHCFCHLNVMSNRGHYCALAEHEKPKLSTLPRVSVNAVRGNIRKPVFVRNKSIFKTSLFDSLTLALSILILFFKKH